MNLKKVKIISIFGIFLLSFLCHFLYDWFPNTLFSIFFSVNESIFEHMKIISSSILIYSIIEYILLKKLNIKYNNFLFSILISIISNIIIFLIIFLPVYYKIGENLPITIFIIFIAIVITQFISYKILSLEKNYTWLNIVSLVFIIIIYVIFAYLTYNPVINEFFFDPLKEQYGINTFLID
ncbi:MAG: DUF6512 family protein [Clostridium sp.]|nr:DUF6512 family protein [Clostridium sp.]MCM1444022.1 DUF6512 family protein [Candidatus Amulumruptor caecigallinarius]